MSVLGGKYSKDQKVRPSSLAFFILFEIFIIFLIKRERKMLKNGKQMNDGENECDWIKCNLCLIFYWGIFLRAQ